MKILVTGSHGLIGSALIPFLTTGGHEVLRLVRNPNPATNEIPWDPQAGVIDNEQLEGLDAVVHLAGENIASKRWNTAQKKRIRESRVHGTRLLSESIARLNDPPKVLVCASAVGYFGDRGDEELDEQSEPGTGFLADVCRDWEAAADPAREKGIRVVNLRFGVILSSAGGALAKMLLPFKLGLGGVVGSGKQYWSWIALDDVLGAILHVISNDDLNGPVNCVSPNPATNREFTKTLGRVLKRPTVFPLPAFAARLALGEMADELLLPSARVIPKRLQESGYEFQYPELEEALRHAL
ncbi:MAG: TIGR01777 family protein [Proteobacteria bacterium]|nr:TIGR01777 family protein [Pseudomonadota bacterium]